MRNATLLLVLCLLAAGCLEPVPPSGSDDAMNDAPVPTALPSKMAWRMLPEGPTHRAETCAASVGPLMYVIGGWANPNEFSLPGPAGAIPYDEPLLTASVDVFDASKETWSAGPTVPTQSVEHCDAIGYDGYVYLFDSGGSWKLKAGGTEWQVLEPWPNSHSYGGYGEIGGNFYFTAGGSAKVDVYDPATDKWTTLDSEIPTNRGHTAGSVSDGKLYVIGGDIGGHSQNTGANEAYDPVTNTWETKAPLPVLRGSLHEVAYRGHIVVMGGQNGGGGVDSFHDVDAYDVATDTWSKLPEMITPKHGFGATVWNDRIYVFAGSPQQGVDATAKASVLEPVG